MDDTDQREVLVHLVPKTDFEKLLFERTFNQLFIAEIKQLKIETGKLKSYIQELEDKNKLPKSILVKARKDELVQMHRKRATLYSNKNRKLSERISELLTENLRLRKIEEEYNRITKSIQNDK
jgi:hypothetical protein